MADQQNRAVMNQRLLEKSNLDYFPTPPWATRALIEHVLKKHSPLYHLFKDMVCWECAAGAGHMGYALEPYFKDVILSDIEPHADCVNQYDFLNHIPDNNDMPHWIITNPPFSQAEDFIEKSLLSASVGVAMFVRNNFAEGIGRYYRLFRIKPPHVIAQFSERVPLVKNRYDPKASTATAYCWMVWFKPNSGKTVFDWIPPCKNQFERPEDVLIGGTV